MTKYSTYDIKGVWYDTIYKDNCSVTQNSGVSLVAKIMQYASAKDNNPIESDMTFYGVVNEIWDLDYIGFRIPIFKCDWVDSNSGVKSDELGFTCVDLSKLGHKFDPFILAAQAKQVFYVQDPIDPRWHVVLSVPQHEVLDDDGPSEADPLANVVHNEFASKVPDLVEEIETINDDNSVYVRNDCEGIWFNT